MSTIKPVVNDRSISNLLSGLFSDPVTGLRCIEGGLIAQTFVFRAGERDYVIRFNADNMDANFDERLLCYQCYIALDGMRFFAKSDNHDSYKWTTDRIEDLIGSRGGILGVIDG